MIGKSDSGSKVAGLKHFGIKVEGRVQGVAFRAGVQREAVRLGLAGTVRNLADGSVMVEAEGPEPALQELVAWCRRGPELADVTRVKASEGGWQGFKGFEIISD